MREAKDGSPYRVMVVTLGCAKNRVDSEVMLAQLAQAGYLITDDPQTADVVIFNTCGFIEAAKRESLAAVLEAAERKTEAKKLILAGCLAQGHGRELAAELPEVDAIVGPGMAGRMATVVREVLAGKRVLALGSRGEWEALPLPRLLTTFPGTAYLKIAEGCNHRCSFCTIPRLRGPYRSRPEEAILTEAAQLAAHGVKELVLIAQDTAAYGYDRYGEFRLPRLVRRLAGLDGIRWLRLLYLHPAQVTRELLEVMATEEKVCRYFDLPLQHSAAAILARMGRPPLRRALSLLEEIRTAMPDAVIRSTFIVGFPGESDQDFAHLCSFLETASLDWVGAFVYSPEEGTRAAALAPPVPDEVKKERWHALMRLQADITARKLRGWVGREAEVLVEADTRRAGRARGRTRGQAPEVDGAVLLRGEAPVGEIVRARLIGVRGYDLLGEVVG